MKIVSVLTAFLACMLAGGNTASAGPITFSTGPGLNIAITDNAYNGTLASMASASLTVTGAESFLTDINVILGLDHTWVGDLVVKLADPYGTVVTLVSRPGAVEVADNGTDSPFGNSANLNRAFPITFDDSAIVSAELMGAGLDTTQVVCRDGGPCDFAPNNGAAAPGNLASFAGIDPNGTWTIYIGDAAAQDLGILDRFSLIVDSVEPTGVPDAAESATLMMLGMVGTGLVALKARRRPTQRRR